MLSMMVMKRRLGLDRAGRPVTTRAHGLLDLVNRIHDAILERAGRDRHRHIPLHRYPQPAELCVSQQRERRATQRTSRKLKVPIGSASAPAMASFRDASELRGSKRTVESCPLCCKVMVHPTPTRPCASPEASEWLTLRVSHTQSVTKNNQTTLPSEKVASFS